MHASAFSEDSHHGVFELCHVTQQDDHFTLHIINIHDKIEQDTNKTFNLVAIPSHIEFFLVYTEKQIRYNRHPSVRLVQLSRPSDSDENERSHKIGRFFLSLQSQRRRRDIGGD